MDAKLKRSATVNSGLLAFMFATSTIRTAAEAASTGSGLAIVFAVIGIAATVMTISDTINLYNSKV